MRTLVLGAGAMGGYFGGRLVEGGQDVTFLVREGRKAVLEKRGLVIDSPAYGNFRSPVHAITAQELAAEAPFDVILVACKSYDLEDAISTIAPAVSADTVVLPMLNGIAHMDVLNARFGKAHVLGGLVRLAGSLTPDGTIKHMNDWRTLMFGEQDGQMTPRVKAFAAAFANTSVIAEAVPNITQEMWDKIVHLCTVASVTCLMRATIGELNRAGGSGVMTDMLMLNAAIAEKQGHRPSDAFVDKYKKLLTDTTAEYGTSMLYDIERGAPIEGDHVVGYMLGLARKHGVPAQLLEVAYVHLKSYEQRRAAGRL